MRIHFNKKAFMLSKQAIRERYFRKTVDGARKAGQSHDEEDEVESEATAEASTDGERASEGGR